MIEENYLETPTPPPDKGNRSISEASSSARCSRPLKSDDAIVAMRSTDTFQNITSRLVLKVVTSRRGKKIKVYIKTKTNAKGSLELGAVNEPLKKNNLWCAVTVTAAGIFRF